MAYSIEELLADERRVIESSLQKLLPVEDTWPTRLHRGMRHAVLSGGKRIRPILARMVTRALARDPESITMAACGLELIHSYSLVHDDLPALDDDTLRRGRPTVHVAFDEATAILVGDALLTEGLAVLSREPAGEVWASRRAEAVALVGAAIGSRGMVGGQMEDLEAGAQVEDEDSDTPAAERLDRIHRHKTGALLEASVDVAAVWAETDYEIRERLHDYGSRLGLAFQISDDLLDLTATAEELGKSPGKDIEQNKLTWISLYGEEKTRIRLRDIEKEMLDLAEAFEGGRELSSLASYVCRRRH